jgi:CheY-like chemotaxis protein
MEKTRILIVDDEEGLTRLVKLALPQYEIREVNTPALALPTAREFKPHMIILDVVMPGLDGGDVAEQFKQDPEFTKTPIIFLTAIATPGQGEDEQTINGYPFIAKPVSREKLVRSIEKHLPK